jgi:hypothetical protein
MFGEYTIDGVQRELSEIVRTKNLIEKNKECLGILRAMERIMTADVIHSLLSQFVLEFINDNVELNEKMCNKMKKFSYNFRMDVEKEIDFATQAYKREQYMGKQNDQ